jgi:hypothetical protein
MFAEVTWSRDESYLTVCGSTLLVEAAEAALVGF